MPSLQNKDLYEIEVAPHYRAGGVVITFAKEILTLITAKKEQLTIRGKLQYIRIFKICCELFAKIHSIP